MREPGAVAFFLTQPPHPPLCCRATSEQIRILQALSASTSGSKHFGGRKALAPCLPSMQTLRQHCRTNGIQTPKQGPSFEVVTKLQDSSPAGRYTAPSFAREGETLPLARM